MPNTHTQEITLQTILNQIQNDKLFFDDLNESALKQLSIMLNDNQIQNDDFALLILVTFLNDHIFDLGASYQTILSKIKNWLSSLTGNANKDDKMIFLTNVTQYCKNQLHHVKNDYHNLRNQQKH